MPRLALLALMVALVAGTSAAFVVTQRLKDERSPVGVPRFDRVLAPTCDCPNERAELRLRLRRADRVSAEIVDEEGRAARVLARDERHPRGPLAFAWDGRDDAGALVADGRYRLRIELERAGRTITLPTTIRVDTQPPRLELVDVLVSGERVRVVYRAASRAAGELSVRGEGLAETAVVRGRFRAAGRAALNWAWRVDGEPVPPGRYTLTLTARDPAGNRSAPLEIPVERPAAQAAGAG